MSSFRSPSDQALPVVETGLPGEVSSKIKLPHPFRRTARASWNMATLNLPIVNKALDDSIRRLSSLAASCESRGIVALPIFGNTSTRRAGRLAPS